MADNSQEVETLEVDCRSHLMNRVDLQQLTEDRIADAQVLLDAGRWSAAYYMAGYAIECALKACIAKQTNQHDFPDKDQAYRAYTHSLTGLVKVVLLHDDMHTTQALANPELYKNWQVVKDWTEQARYEQTDEKSARELHAAITDANSGVLSWVKRN
jgi:HEPN domain-containing protein